MSTQVSSEVGVLISCDSAAKEIILYICSTNYPRAILADLDDTHLVVHPDYVKCIKDKIIEYVDDEHGDKDKIAKRKKEQLKDTKKAKSKKGLS